MQLAPETILRMLHHFDLKLNYALNHQFYCLQENKKSVVATLKKETLYVFAASHTVSALCWSCALRFPQQKMQIIKTPAVEYLLGVQNWAVPHFAETDISAKTINRLSLPPR